MPDAVQTSREAALQTLFEALQPLSLAPLWTQYRAMLTPTPQGKARPYLWRYAELRPHLLRTGELISTREAERRVLMLMNPGLEGQAAATSTLFAGMQLILPGEIARAHRHSPSALRVVVEGCGAYTAVDGERCLMEPGDLILTPSWSWHDHGNESDAPMVWIDGLDMHIVNLLSASFREGYPGRTHPVTRPEGSAMAEAGYNLVPVDFEARSQTSPIFNYPYHRTREALDQVSRLRAPDACHGYKMHYINPLNGKSAMPTITTAMQLLPQGFSSLPYRSTAGTVFSVVEGHGAVTIGEQRFVLGPKDLFVVPSWHSYRLEAQSDLVIFSYSDRVVQEKLDLFREMRGND